MVAGVFLGIGMLAFPGEAAAKRYDIIVGGKLTKQGAVVGRTTREGDREDDRWRCR